MTEKTGYLFLKKISKIDKPLERKREDTCQETITSSPEVIKRKTGMLQATPHS